MNRMTGPIGTGDHKRRSLSALQFSSIVRELGDDALPQSVTFVASLAFLGRSSEFGSGVQQSSFELSMIEMHRSLEIEAVSM